MRKVLLISSVPPPMGGIAKWTSRMLSSKLEDNWEIELVDDRIIGKREPFGDEIKYNIANEIKRWVGVWFRLWKACKKDDVYIVHACPIATRNSMLVNIVSAIISRLKGKKHIIHFRCTVPNLVKTSSQLVLLRILCKLSSQIIALNKQTFIFLKNNTTTPVIIIPNFVDSQEMQSDKIINAELKTALYVGGVTKEKGCDDLISIAKLCRDIEFRLVGVASSEIKQLADGVSNVKLVGLKNKTDVIEEMRNADVFFFLSRFWGEGFSNAITEAMAAGLPCIVTDWAANADQIDNGKGGFVVRDNIVAEAVSAITKLNDKHTRVSCSSYNMHKVRVQYSSKFIIGQYVKLYNCLLNG